MVAGSRLTLRMRSATRSVRSSALSADREGVHALGDGIAHREARVERRAGILHDDLDLAPEGQESAFGRQR